MKGEGREAEEKEDDDIEGGGMPEEGREGVEAVGEER